MNAVVVVTGGASGMGAATVERLLRRGCEVHILDRAQPSNATQTASTNQPIYTVCDMGDVKSIGHALGQLPERLDALINVAGVAYADPPEQTIAINFLGLRLLTEALLPRLRTGSSIVIVASTAGRRWAEHRTSLTPLLATPTFEAGMAWLRNNPEIWHHEPYRFSKFAAAAYTYRATQLALPHGVRVNCVNPGVVETQLSPAFREIVGPKLYDWGVAQIGRPGTPADIAEILEFLAIGECTWLNGIELVVDGGYTAGVIGGWIDPTQAPPDALTSPAKTE